MKAEGLRVKTNGAIREVSLEVIPFGPTKGTKGRHYLILFSALLEVGPPAIEALLPRGFEAQERHLLGGSAPRPLPFWPPAR